MHKGTKNGQLKYDFNTCSSDISIIIVPIAIGMNLGPTARSNQIKTKKRPFDLSFKLLRYPDSYRDEPWTYGPL